MRERRSSGAFPVRTAARLAGVSADLIRAWERRYGVIAPRRGPRGARLYSASDIEHLTLLGEAVRAGRNIGDVAGLGREALRALVERDRRAGETRSDAASTLSSEGERRPSARARGASARAPASEGLVTSNASAILQRVLAAARAYDAREVERELSDGLAALGRDRYARDLAASPARGRRPLGDGEISIAAEHLVSNALRNLLGGLVRTARAGGGVPILLATPSGERHELGLFLAALRVLEAGGSVVYLGGDVPAEEICRAAASAGARAVGLSIVAQANRARAGSEVRELERLLDPGVAIWVGGRDASAACGASGLDGSRSSRGSRASKRSTASRAVVVSDLDALALRVVRLARNA